MKLRLGQQDHGCNNLVGFIMLGLLASRSIRPSTAAAAATTDATRYTEDLAVERLGKHHVGARFLFRSHWVPETRHRCQDHEDWQETGESAGGPGRAAEGRKLCHFEAVFPRAVGVLLDRFKVRDLSLRMSKGRWDTAAWGNGPGDGASGEYTPGGAEMWTRLPVDSAWESWIGLRRSLSGLYCSSLDGMDETRVHTPAKMVLPGETFQTHSNTTVLRGILPREPVCTENLIPLIKMLPCRSKTGLGRLLHPTRLFQSDYHSISVRASATFSNHADENPETARLPRDIQGSNSGEVITSLTLEHTVLAVFRPRPHLPSVVPLNKPRGLGSAEKNEDVDIKVIPEGEGWSFASLLLPLKSASFGAERAEMIKLPGCPVAARSAIHVVTRDNVLDAVDSPSSSSSCAFSDLECDVGLVATGKRVATRLVPSTTDGDLDPASEERTSRPSSVSDFLQAELWNEGGDAAASFGGTEVTAISQDGSAVARLENYLSGRGGTRGVAVAHLINMHPISGALVDFLQPVPYFMVPLVGTLRARSISSSSSDIVSSLDHAAAPRDFESTVGPLVSLARNLTLTPGEGRRPALVEVRLWVPAESTVVLGFDFLKRFLAVDDFPPDPSRGFDIPPPLARFSFAEGEGEVGTEVGSRKRAEEGGGESGQGGVDTCGAFGGVDGGAPQGKGPGQARERVVYAYGEAALLDTPQPDFSMPFNVITFSSTVITFFLGTAINLLVRKSKKTNKKGGSSEASSSDSDKAENAGEGAGRMTCCRYSWFGGPRTVLGTCQGAFMRLGGGSSTSRRTPVQR